MFVNYIYIYSQWWISTHWTHHYMNMPIINLNENLIHKTLKIIHTQTNKQTNMYAYIKWDPLQCYYPNTLLSHIFYYDDEVQLKENSMINHKLTIISPWADLDLLESTTKRKNKCLRNQHINWYSSSNIIFVLLSR